MTESCEYCLVVSLETIDFENRYWFHKAIDINKVKRQVVIKNWYNQILHFALKTKREITKYINWQQFTKGTRGKPNEQLFPQTGGHSAT